ncbi:MAG: GNAT family N-acetyltransferase [Bacilli bacterium]|nr:GNAT family N-acetyltransferase [Bacilli bacterium]
MENYICKIASIEDIIKMYDEEIYNCSNKEKMIEWKNMTIERVKNGFTIIYIGLLDDLIISECSVTLNPTLVNNSENLVNDKTAYLHAFNTKEEYQNKGYFSKLFRFMIDDLKNRGYKKVTLGVDKKNKKNKDIYTKYGFKEHIKDVHEEYYDGTTADIEYYGKEI